MKESEFIELLNLYLDHEISAADAVRLEAEVQANGARRKVYQQYCRMQKACKVLTSDFQTDGAEAGVATERKVIAFNPQRAAAIAAQRRRTNVVLTFGTLAAAACVAVILVNRGDRSPNRAQDTAPALVQHNASATAAGAQRFASETSGPRALGNRNGAAVSQTTLVTDPLLLTKHTEAEATVVAANDGADQLKWINSVQLRPLQQGVPADELRFDVRPATLRPDPRTLPGNRAPAEAKVEMTAFRFVK